MKYKFGIDVGGTFTDLVLFNEETNEIIIDKVPSTPGAPNLAVINGINKLILQEELNPSDIISIMHGTTVATNALLEGKGEKCALITTEGFKDILYIARQDRPHLYDFSIKRAKPFIPRNLIFEVEERILHTGEISNPINKDQVYEIIKEIKESNIKSIAVCLLHSYINLEHEQILKEIINEIYPEAIVCLSSEILPEIKEYERMSTTITNAYIVPIVKKYLEKLENNLIEIGIKSRLYVMESNGGIMTSELSKQKGVHLIMSGPAGGVIGAFQLSQKVGFNNIITVDMGGTSFDISLICDGKIKLSTDTTEIGPYSLKVPTIDIHTIGSGGGSIAWIDEGGALRVGPQSSGAEPGPSCYSKGGTEPTVTDANLILGRLNPDFLLGGKIKLNYDLAHKAIKEKISDPLNISLEEAALGIISVVNANMIKGIRYVSIERGYDPRDFCLVPYGGCGPLHAAELAEELKISKVLVPRAPGVSSALGLLLADFRQDYSRTYINKLENINIKIINSIFKDMELYGINEIIREGVSREKIKVLRSVDVRYQGQGYELNVPIMSDYIDNKKLLEIKNSFDDLHEKNYGFKRDDDLEFVNLRISIFGEEDTPDLNKIMPGVYSLKEALKGFRNVFIGNNFIKTPIYDREKLGSGCKFEGPAIIEQKDSTTTVLPGQIVKSDNYGNLIITLS